MIRRRQNFAGGLITDAPLTSSATTMNSDQLAQVMTITSGLYLPITLDPDAVSGEPEIIWITAHTSAATSATIQRGKEGTVAREHAQGVFWIHAPTTQDYTTIINTDGNPGTTLYVGSVDPSTLFTLVDGDIWMVP